MDAQLRKVLNGANEDFPKPKAFNLNRGQIFPEKMPFLEYRFDMIETWWPWLKSEDYVIPSTASVADVLIPTKESNCLSYWIDISISARLPMLVVGPSGTGKTATILSHINQLATKKYLRNIINFSVNTTAEQVFIEKVVLLFLHIAH